MEKDELLLDTYGVKTNNLFFADDASIHSTDSKKIQKILDIANDWQLDYGMNFAPEKCFVLSSQKNLKLQMGENFLPQVDAVNYLGIPLNTQGFDTKKFVKKCAQKMESAVMQIVKGGYTNKNWSPGVKLAVYKQFIRPTAEYGLQVKILENGNLDLLESAQLKALRILMHLPWNASIQAMRRLFCLESFNCTNL